MKGSPLHRPTHYYMPLNRIKEKRPLPSRLGGAGNPLDAVACGLRLAQPIGPTESASNPEKRRGYRRALGLPSHGRPGGNAAPPQGDPRQGSLLKQCVMVRHMMAASDEQRIA